MSTVNLQSRITFSVDFRQGVPEPRALGLIETTLGLERGLGLTVTRNDYADEGHPRSHFIVIAETPGDQDPFEFAKVIAKNLRVAPEVSSAYSPHVGTVEVRAPDASYEVFVKVCYDHTPGE